MNARLVASAALAVATAMAAYGEAAARSPYTGREDAPRRHRAADGKKVSSAPRPSLLNSQPLTPEDLGSSAVSADSTGEDLQRASHEGVLSIGGRTSDIPGARPAAFRADGPPAPAPDLPALPEGMTPLAGGGFTVLQVRASSAFAGAAVISPAMAFAAARGGLGMQA